MMLHLQVITSRGTQGPSSCHVLFDYLVKVFHYFCVFTDQQFMTNLLGGHFKTMCIILKAGLKSLATCNITLTISLQPSSSALPGVCMISLLNYSHFLLPALLPLCSSHFLAIPGIYHLKLAPFQILSQSVILTCPLLPLFPWAGFLYLKCWLVLLFRELLTLSVPNSLL